MVAKQLAGVWKLIVVVAFADKSKAMLLFVYMCSIVSLVCG